MLGRVPDNCIAACAQCWEACERAARFCLERGAGYDDRGRVGTLIQCSAFARTLADFLRTGNELAVPTLGILASLCRRCASLCSEFDDEPLVDCAQQCLRCAESAERERAAIAAR